MLRFVVRRLLLLVPILLGVSILVFAWVHALPGSPLQSLLGERATPALVKQYQAKYGLNRPIPLQYWDYVKTTVHADFGTSIATHRQVSTELRERFPATIELAVAAMIVALALGIPLGVLAAKHYGGPLDHASLVVSLLGISTPIFFLALVLKYIFAVKLGWLPSVGRIDVTINTRHPTGFYVLDALIQGQWSVLWDVLKHLILPALALGSVPLAVIARITRAAVVDVQNEDYVRTARAKGMSPSVVDRRHILRNAMLPISTVIGLQTGLLLSGAILTETVFEYPGMGSWLRDAIFNRDYPVLQGGILFLAIVFVLVNLVVDISYAIFNPRIRYSS
jgi:peptide/nickel transport system permease protein